MEAYTIGRLARKMSPQLNMQRKKICPCWEVLNHAQGLLLFFLVIIMLDLPGEPEELYGWR
jgi:hypothetical protein